MKVKVIATKTTGNGVIAGDFREYDARIVTDRGDHISVFVGPNWEVLVSKDSYRIEIE